MPRRSRPRKAAARQRDCPRFFRGSKPSLAGPLRAACSTLALVLRAKERPWNLWPWPCPPYSLAVVLHRQRAARERARRRVAGGRGDPPPVLARSLDAARGAERAGVLAQEVRR